jgi:hypothetical protein
MSDPGAGMGGGPEDRKLQRELALYRGLAINAYAGLEQSLFMIMADLGEIPHATARLIFFRISNARARNEIVDKLKKAKFGSKNNLFWNSVMKEIGLLDQRRNQVVHWHTNIFLGGDWAGVPSSSGLSNPGQLGGASPKMTIADLKDFSSRCNVFSQALHQIVFYWRMVPPGTMTPSLEIFQRPLTYPPPPGHPLFPKPKALHTRPRSSRPKSRSRPSRP